MAPTSAVVEGTLYLCTTPPEKRRNREKGGETERERGEAMSDPTDQRHPLFQALQQQEQRRQVFPQQQMAMQQQVQVQGLPARAPPPQGLGGVALMPPTQVVGLPAQAAAAARARAAEQMAFEDAWKASNPDIKTPFASVEDAVTRCVRPYRVAGLLSFVAILLSCYSSCSCGYWIFVGFTVLSCLDLALTFI